MPSTTIRFHVGADPVLKHNNRTKKIVKYEPHIDPAGHHESWLDGTLEDKYAELFGEAIQEYNKGRRKDRQLTVAKYMDKVAGDRRGRTNKAASKATGREVKGKHLAYEAIVGVGNTNQARDADGHIVRAGDGSRLMPQHVRDEANRAIVREYCEGFEARNATPDGGGLKLVSAQWHQDEFFH